VTVNEKITDTNGRIIILKCEIQGEKFLIYNIYAPNDKNDHKTFLLDLKEKLDAINITEYEYIIGAGDWNFTSEHIDRKGGNYTQWNDNIDIMEEMTTKFDLIDIWRVRNPEKTRYTFRQKSSSGIIQSRIDRIYVSDTLQYNIHKTDIIPGLKSDHSAITIQIKPTNSMGSGPNFWKFNNSLLKNQQFTTGLKHYIETELDTECKEIHSSQAKWEYMKFKIKKWSIIKSKEIAREKRKNEAILIEKIEKLEEKMSTQPTEILYHELERSKTDLEKIHELKTQSLIIQSRIQVYEDGEKSTSFFLNQIKQNKRKSTIRKLIVDEKEITDQSKILTQLHDFYEKLYTKDKRCQTGDWINNLRSKGLVPQLSEEETLQLDAPITKKELLEILKKCANNKSPGNDGLTKEFYEAFWETIIDALYQSYLESITIGKLSTSQRQNIISLLEKAGKDKTYIKNWRPISLINFDTKLLSKAYADRLKEVMPSLVHPNQVAYVKNRFIGEGIRTIDETMHYTKMKNIEAYAVAIDFEKAFDSVDWNYMWEALEAYNIPQSFIDMIKLIYNDIESCVANNGTSTRYFKIGRGVRQGDPIAAYLFTLVIELLAIEIRENDRIRGIQINSTTIKLSMYADDMTGLVIGIKSIIELMETIQKFKIYSGLGVNDDKTEIMPLGSAIDKIEQLKTLGYKIVTELKITGVVFTYDEKVSTRRNFDVILQSMKKMFDMWKQRNMSLIGKIQVIKTAGVSRLIFITNMRNTPPHIIKKANAILYSFLWNGTEKVKRLTMISDIANGGLKMPHLESIIETEKIIWIKRYSNEKYHPWKEFLENSLAKSGSIDILNRKLPNTLIVKSEMSEFNKDMLLVWNKTQNSPCTPEEIGNQSLWSNQHIKTPNNKTINYVNISKSGINNVKDLIVNGKMLTTQDINEKNTTMIEKMQLKSILECLPKSWREADYETTTAESFKKSREEKIKSMVSKKVYKGLIEKIQVPATAIGFYEKLFNTPGFEMKFFYSIPFRTTVYTKLRSFQFKINHNIIFTNEKLHRIGIKDSPNCSFCNSHIETLPHLFAECEIIKNIWENIINDLLPPYGIRNLTTENILLGIILKEKQNNIINHIILEAKYYIYVCKLEGSVPSYNRLINRLKITENIEEQIAYKKGKLATHVHKWFHLINYVCK